MLRAVAASMVVLGLSIWGLIVSSASMVLAGIILSTVGVAVSSLAALFFFVVAWISHDTNGEWDW